ncbi:Endo-1,4-beta-xylanase Z precursor [Roseivivax jejudonensis]|uniref:Endo-1,4-beta-xylanase Z n=2 Tax=Roseivivax jejudonensis TaxID=1529041 RepID=A0A1X6ZYJ7_9RHOB|nr:Endo-1,4-beta-xylanase Z precursor [Roseivivax jejudonensis]
MPTGRVPARTVAPEVRVPLASLFRPFARRAACALVLALSCLLPHPAAADILTDRTAPSPGIAGGLDYSVYVPPGSDAAGPLPVIVLLHGLGASAREWIGAVGIEEIADRLIAAGDMPPTLIVMPNAGRSWYVDSARYDGPGDYETAIARDLLAHVDTEFSTRGEGQRAIAGYSMGGHGALRLAFRHPDTFAAVGALAPAIWKPGGVSERGAPTNRLSAEQRAAWFPNTTGRQFDPDVLQAQSPFAEVAALADLPAPPAVMLAVGDEDYFEFHDGTLEMYLDLRRIGRDPELRVIEGGHDPAFIRAVIGDVLIFLSDAMAADG